MDMSSIIFGAVSLSTLSPASLEASGESSKTSTENGAPLKVDPSDVGTNKLDAKLNKIKEEIKKMAVLPSSDEIVEKYGITKAQAQQVLAEVCMEIATDAGSTPEEITKTASALYMMAEMADTEVLEVFDATELIQQALAKEQAEKEKALSAKEVSEKYGITLEQAQAVLDEKDKDENNNTSSLTNSDLSAEPTYCVRNSGGGQFNISLNTCSFALSTVCYDT